MLNLFVYLFFEDSVLLENALWIQKNNNFGSKLHLLIDVSWNYFYLENAKSFLLVFIFYSFFFFLKVESKIGEYGKILYCPSSFILCNSFEL